VILGLLFGPFGALIEALLPTITREQRAQVEESQRLLEVKEKRQRYEEWLRTQTLAQEARARRAERALRRRKLRRELWESTPAWARMAIIGLGIGGAVCVPVVVYGLWPSSDRQEATSGTNMPQPIISPAQVAPAAAEPSKAPTIPQERPRPRPTSRASPPPEQEDNNSVGTEVVTEIEARGRDFEEAGSLESAAICYRILAEDYPNTRQGKAAIEKLKEWGEAVDLKPQAPKAQAP
jgi:hypothetical protein